MKEGLLAMALLAVICGQGAQADEPRRMSGEREFKKHCATCHPNGGNTTNPAKPLDRKSLEKSGIKTWQQVVAKMRNPGHGMTRFERKDISDREARAIAEYMLKAFP